MTVVSFVLDAEVELLTKPLPADIPNNISKYQSSAKPIPPSQIKCNILKCKSCVRFGYFSITFCRFVAKAEEELQNGLGLTTKLTNQMFVAAANNEEGNLNSLNAATFVSVVS